MNGRCSQNGLSCALRGVVWGAVLGLSALAHADETARTGTFSGTVVDFDGNTISGAHITMMPYEYGGWPNPPGTKRLFEATSDSSGRFRLGPLQPAYRMLFDLQVEADGFAPQYVPSGKLSIFTEHDSDLGRICMFRGRVVTGQVLDVDGKPRAGAKVSVEVGRLFCGYVVSRIGP